MLTPILQHTFVNKRDLSWAIQLRAGTHPMDHSLVGY